MVGAAGMANKNGFNTGGSSQLAREEPKPVNSMKMVALARPNTVFSTISALKAGGQNGFWPAWPPLDPSVTLTIRHETLPSNEENRKIGIMNLTSNHVIFF